MAFWTAIIGGALGGRASAAGGSLGSAGGFVIGNVLGAGINIVSTSIGNAVGRSVDAQVNQQWPSVRPDAPQILAAYYGGMLNANNTSTALRELGIPWDISVLNDWQQPLKTVWGRVVNILQPQLTVEQAISFRNAGHITFQVYSDYINRHGLTQQSKEDLERWIPPVPLEVAISQFWLYPQREDYWRQQVQMHGFARGLQDNNLLNAQAPFPPAFTMGALWRGELSENEANRHLRAWGFTQDEFLSKFKRASRPIPPPSDLIHFSVREVWADDVVNRFGYDEEYPFHFDYWMAQQGLKWGEGAVNHQGLQLNNINWPLAYWRSHWVAMSPSQAYTAWHRVRPERVEELSREIPGITPFTWEDLNTALKVSDYPPAVRKWLAASSYALPRLIDIRQAFVQGVRDEGWAIDQLRDRGLRQSTALDITALWRTMRERQETTTVRAVERSGPGKLAREIITGYRLGLINRLDATRRLFQLGVAEQAIAPLLDSEDMRSRREEIVSYIKSVQREYMEGAVSDPEALAALIGAGVQQGSAGNYLRNWRLRRTFKRRMLSSAEILRYTKEGLIPSEVARQRLLNLGWSNPDALIAVQSAVSSLNTSRGRAIVAAERQSVGKVKELEGVQRKAQALVRQTQADLRRITPIATLKQWLARDIVTEPYVRARLKAQGYPDEEIEHYITDWTGAKGQSAEGAGAPAEEQGGSQSTVPGE